MPYVVETNFLGGFEILQESAVSPPHYYALISAILNLI